MSTSRIKHYIRALVLATFLSVIGPVGLVAQSAAQIKIWRKAAEQGYAWAWSMSRWTNAGRRDVNAIANLFRLRARDGPPTMRHDHFPPNGVQQ
jgi:hypothetical protein